MKGRLLAVVLSLSAVGFAGILSHEGYSDKAYVPVKGDVRTIGFGTTEGVKPGDVITPPVAINRALADVSRFEKVIGGCVSVPLHQYEYDAYVSLAYNIGGGAFCGSTLVKLLNAGDYAGACEQIKRWTFVGRKEVKGLVNRRQAEYKRCIGE